VVSVPVLKPEFFSNNEIKNILIPAITLKDLQPLKTIENTSRNTNCDTKLRGKKTSKCKKEIKHT
jgi:hypothetical protein